MTVAVPLLPPADWRDFLALTKPRVMTLVVFTGLCGMLAAPVGIDPVIGFTAILCIALAVALDHFKRGKHWDEAMLIVVLAFFVLFYPVLSAARLSGPNAFHFWTWFPSWV